MSRITGKVALVTDGNSGIALGQSGSSTRSSPALGPIEPDALVGCHGDFISVTVAFLHHGIMFVLRIEPMAMAAGATDVDERVCHLRAARGYRRSRRVHAYCGDNCP